MPKGKNVVWAFFESTVLPDVYVNYYNSADVVWAPSNWANSILLKNGVKAEKIHIVPGGVCPATFNPFERKIRKVRDSNVFRFLAIGKYEERKGYTQLFEAFKLAFENNPNVELIVKADCFANLDVKKHELNIKINDLNIENIRIAEGAFSVNDMVALYNYADCFVYPSRAEGWGLPLIEAIACGLPVLATNYSGHGEFLSKIDGYYVPIDYKMVQIGAEFRKLWSIENKHDAFWAEADIVDMASKMRNLVSTRHESKLKANVASDIIRTDFTWQKSIDAGINSISDLLS
jgi:glycosyltransferase involved in cell wall biosynthesis